MRIGPWAHGEVREGGFPDWLVTEAETPAQGDSYELELLHPNGSVTVTRK